MARSDAFTHPSPARAQVRPPTLAEFAQEAHARVRAGYYRTEGAPLPAGASLASAIRAKKGRALVAEIKPASPTEGAMRRDADAATLARDLARAGAAGLSALAEPTRFGGSIANVRDAARAGIPVLFKDFVVHEDQMRAARAAGASAILLILDILPEPADDMIARAHAHGLETLLEAYDRAGVERALATETDLVGVNQRDLRREGLPIDRDAARNALAGLSPDRPVLALSGVRDAADARAAFEAGAWGILVGTTLMKAQDPAEALRRLLEASP